MFSSTSSFPFASLFPQQPSLPQLFNLGQNYPSFGQSFYQNLQTPLQQQSSLPFANLQNPAGLYGGPNVYPEQMSVAIEELLRDRQRDIYLDALIMKLLESSRFYRQSDHVLRHFVEGKALSKEEAVKNLLADRRKDQDIANVITSIVNERKDRSIDQILAHFSLGIPISPGTFLVKQQKQKAFDQEIDQAVRNLMNRDTAVYGMGGFSRQGDEPVVNLNPEPQT